MTAMQGILEVLAVRGSAHGWLIRETLRIELGIAFSGGTIYPALESLLGKGLIEFDPDSAPTVGRRGGRPTKPYRLTDLGWDALVEQRAAFERLRKYAKEER